MREQLLKTWEDFEKVLIEINDGTRQLKGNKQLHVDYPLFRGHSDSEWHLESTLDRIQREMSLSDYYRIVQIIHKHVTTCTGRTWDLNTKVHLGEFDLPAYEFMAYLRHNGFPSPLLDWTRSPYIAAYFAFRDVYLYFKKNDAFAAKCPIFKDKYGHVSIFMFREFAGNAKGWCEQEPHIRTLGPTIATHRNHYLQQSEYLLCVKKESNDKWIFDNYEDVTPHENQDVLVKYNIPISEQQKVLGKLDSMNITAYSLFNSEPSLMETLALREIVFEMKDRL